MKIPSLVLVLMGVLTGCSNKSEPSHLRLINLVHRSEHLAIRVCPEKGGDCNDLSLGPDQVTPSLDLPPGRYRFEIPSRTHPGSSIKFTYGLASGEYYGLALYGIDVPANKPNAATRIGRMLGGIEKPRIMNDQLTRRMVSMQPKAPAEPATIRIVNLAPGTSSFSARVDMGANAVSLGPVAYGALSAPAKLDRPSGRLSLMVQGSGFPLTSRDMTFPPGSNTVIYIASLDGSYPKLVIDQRPARYR